MDLQYYTLCYRRTCKWETLKAKRSIVNNSEELWSTILEMEIAHSYSIIDQFELSLQVLD